MRTTLLYHKLRISKLLLCNSIIQNPISLLEQHTIKLWTNQINKILLKDFLPNQVSKGNFHHYKKHQPSQLQEAMSYRHQPRDLQALLLDDTSLPKKLHNIHQANFQLDKFYDFFDAFLSKIVQDSSPKMHIRKVWCECIRTKLSYQTAFITKPNTPKPMQI